MSNRQNKKIKNRNIQPCFDFRNQFSYTFSQSNGRIVYSKTIASFSCGWYFQTSNTKGYKATLLIYEAILTVGHEYGGGLASERVLNNQKCVVSHSLYGICHIF